MVRFIVQYHQSNSSIWFNTIPLNNWARNRHMIAWIWLQLLLPMFSDTLPKQGDWQHRNYIQTPKNHDLVSLIMQWKEFNWLDRSGIKEYNLMMRNKWRELLGKKALLLQLSMSKMIFSVIETVYILLLAPAQRLEFLIHCL